METVNTILKDGVYVPESIEMDPYSEFQYVDERSSRQQEASQPRDSSLQQPSQQSLDGISKNIDQFFDGVDMFFNLANQIQRRFNGGQNDRRRRRLK